MSDTTPETEKDKRLAEALRANLRRRKAAGRKVKTNGETDTGSG